jgi:hypothetical protein
MELTDEIRKAIHSQLTTPPAHPSEHHAREYRYMEHYSDALAVDPQDVEEATKNARAHGCMVDYCPKTGRPKITSANQYRQLCEATGRWNGKDGFRMYDPDGNPVRTGRESYELRKELRRKLERGEITLC